jgi:hypothetical protein
MFLRHCHPKSISFTIQIRFVTLGLVFRRVEDDLATQIVTLTLRWFWPSLERCSFAFRHITTIIYGYAYV